MRVLTAARHTSPLKLGHHRGNRFTIRIRGADAGRVPAARRALERFTLRGMPNAYGAQRFGIRRTVTCSAAPSCTRTGSAFLARLLGRAVAPRARPPRRRRARRRTTRATCRGARPLPAEAPPGEEGRSRTLLRTGSPREAFLALGRRPRRIWVAAWQSYLFNRILDRARARRHVRPAPPRRHRRAARQRRASFPSGEAAHRAGRGPHRAARRVRPGPRRGRAGADRTRGPGGARRGSGGLPGRSRARPRPPPSAARAGCRRPASRWRTRPRSGSASSCRPAASRRCCSST